MTVFYKHVISAEAKSAAGRVDLTARYVNVIVIKACYTVITRIEIAVRNLNIVAGGNMYSVVSAEYRDI